MLPAQPDVPSAAAAAYASRIDAVTGSRAAFVAHAYTRHLGDLSGGQLLRTALQRSLGLDEHSGGAFFAFPGLRPERVAQDYRTGLDALPLASAEREELVAETLVAYALNAALARELDGAGAQPSSAASAKPRA